MFDGPGHSAIPSSVSRMSYNDRGVSGRMSSGDRRRRGSQDSSRISLTRRQSGDSAVLTDEEGGHSGDDDEGDAVSVGTGRGRRQRRSSPPPPRATVFGNLANLFGRNSAEESSRRRPSLSQRSSTSSRRWGRHSDAGSDYAIETDDEGQERWGYSSGEEDYSDDESQLINGDDYSQSGIGYDSYPGTPNSASLPLLSNDPIFGDEARIDIDLPLDDLDPPPPGPPSRQTIYVPDEDSTFRFVGYETIIWRQYLWRFGCILTFGILGLFGHWFPNFWLKWVAVEKAFVHAKHGFVVVEVGLSTPPNTLLPLMTIEECI